MATKRSRTFFTEQAIKEYEKRIAPKPEKRDYVQEEANTFLQEAAKASINRTVSAANKSKFIKESKEWMLQECIYKIFNEALSSVISTNEYDTVSENLRHAMVYNFIRENGGTDRLMDRFYHTNMLLSEIAQCVDHYHSIIVSEVSKKDEGKCKSADGCSYQIPSDVQDDFYKELDMADFGDVTIQISNRVVDAIDKFVTDNVESMNNIKDILNTTKEKIAANKKGVSEAALSNSAKRRISNIKNNRSVNVFGAMMEQTAKAIMKDDNLREAFTENASLDIGRIKTYCAVSYTMLETVNTAKMIYVNEDYIKNMIDSI